MRTWRLAMPVGVRSCREGGRWEVCRTADGTSYWYEELSRLKSGTNSIEFKFARQELKSKMRRAETGRLTLSTRSNPGDVEQMERHPKILEIRLTNRMMDGSKRHVRLYFTEPDIVRDQLLLLMLASKQPGRIGLKEQDAHVDECIQRADDHLNR